MKPNLKSFTWLLTGAILMVLSNGRWIIPIATWFYPIFFLRYLRSRKPMRGFIFLLLTIGIVNAISWWKMAPLPVIIYFVLSILFYNVVSLAFLADRLIATKMKSFLSTLAFPAAWCSLEYLCTFSPKASWNVLAYTQRNLPLLQLVSVTGIWGISFLIAWFASVVNWAWEQHFEWKNIRRGVAIFAASISIVFLFGIIRLQFQQADNNRVRVASIVAERNINAELSKCKWNDAKSIGVYSSQVENNLLEKTIEAARSGAKIILWQESAGFIPKQEEKQFLQRAASIANKDKIYLLATLWSVPEDFPKHLVENKLVIIDTNGKEQLTYLKNHPAPPEPIEKGSGRIPSLQTPFGKIAPAICFDAEFQNFIRQAGKNNVDIMLIPANDWKEIDALHTHMSVMRAIENGFSLVHPAGQGLSVTADNRGRIISSLNFFSSGEQMMYADIPFKHSPTIYSQVGDLFAWLCIGITFSMILSAIFKSRNQNSPGKKTEFKNLELNHGY